jgi:ATP adenylyltransferase
VIYEELVDYIDNRMKMSYIYQPVMLMELLSNNGTLKDSEIAKSILAHDQSQIDYYTKITNNMVGRVLRNNSVVTRDRATKCFSLIGFENLNAEQIETLKEKSLQRLEAYLDSRDPFGHRRRSPGYISGSIRYQVLKRAKFHCELCGISAEEKALEVDHILPRNCGGSDELSNLQALCYSCNSMKRDTDDTDFRAVRESYSHRAADCLFCDPEKQRMLAENELAYVFADGFPVTEGHALVIPKRHVANYFELGQAEINACTSLLNEQQELAKQNDASIEGFNIGVNVGEAAGQTIMHCHIHLIPRRKGDVEDPVGGVRHTIPGKGNYRKAQK